MDIHSLPLHQRVNASCFHLVLREGVLTGPQPAGHPATPREPRAVGAEGWRGSLCPGFPPAALTPPGKFFLPVHSFPQTLSNTPDSGILFSGLRPPRMCRDHLPASTRCPYGKRLRHTWRPQPGPGGFRPRSSWAVFSWGSPPAWLEHWWTPPVSMETEQSMGPLPRWPQCSITGSERRPASTGAEKMELKMGRKQVPSLHQESGPSRQRGKVTSCLSPPSPLGRVAVGP